MCDSLRCLIAKTFSGTAPALPLAALAGAKQARKGSPKLWEISARYHCPLIGTCLEVEELRKLARQAGVDAADATDYELHSLSVNEAGEATRLSRLLQKHLEKKYAAFRKRFAQAETEADLKRLWQDAWKQGEVAGAFWVVMTHPLAGEDLQHTVYAEVHMLSHQVGALQRADLRKLHTLQQREADWRVQMDALRREAQARDQRLQAMQRELAEARLLARKPSEPADTQELDSLRQSLRQAQSENAALREQLAGARGRNKRLQAYLLAAREEQDRLARERESLELHLQTLLAPEPCSTCELSGDSGCTLPRGRDTCVLYVGGRDKLKPHFRALVEKNYGGRFLHHDGGLHGKDQYLQQVLHQADIVLCPVDCVSHNACRVVKQFCKKHDKPMIFLNTDSLSAFTHRLREGLEHNRRTAPLDG
jgi:hypothetical protein